MHHQLVFAPVLRITHRRTITRVCLAGGGSGGGIGEHGLQEQRKLVDAVDWVIYL